MTRHDDLDALGPAFRWSEARDAGITQPRLQRLLEQGKIERLEHGLYIRTGAADHLDLDLLEAAAASELATLCLSTALARHDLIDEIPSKLHLALPRGTHRPSTSPALQWHLFAADTFALGRETLDIDPSTSIGIYSAERSIIDAYRLRHLHGIEMAREALRNWLRRRGSSPAELLELADAFPTARAQLRDDLQVLL